MNNTKANYFINPQIKKTKQFRTPLKDRTLPFYTKGEEIINTVSHTLGAALGIAALALCVVFTALRGNVWGVVSGSIYGASLVLLYTMSSVYHGIRHEFAKKVMQVVDHCTIYFLIAGSYTPIALCAIRSIAPITGWVLFGVVWGLAIVAATLTAIDLKKFKVFSMICYIGMGWSIVFAAKTAIAAIPETGLWYLLAGGISYTVGAVLYGLGKKHRYMHSVFHIFVVAGSVLQFVCIFFYVLL
ncbi:MAG: hemolysin III family protein [Ruminococcaceae bacterium]|nr:hemolysin III family protein [Oscillospiraceae bacterium]